MLDYRSIISQSWTYTQENKKLIFWFGFLVNIFTLTVGAGMIAYQFFAFKSSHLFGSEDPGFFMNVGVLIWDFVKAHFSLTLSITIFGIIFGIIYFLYPTLAKAAAIQTISRNKSGQKNAGVGKGLRYGALSFLPLLEYHLLLKTFSFFTILTQMSSVIRNFGSSMFQAFLPFFIIAMIVGFILTLLFTYTEFFIVIDGKSVFESIKASSKMVVLHWQYTFLITILMLLIVIKIMIQVIIVFMIPFMIVLITGYIATVALPFTGVLIGSIFGFLALLLSAYLSGVVDIFSYTVWTFTFLEISGERDLSPRDKEELSKSSIVTPSTNLEAGTSL